VIGEVDSLRGTGPNQTEVVMPERRRRKRQVRALLGHLLVTTCAAIIPGIGVAWSQDSVLSSADASFFGEVPGDRLGWSVSGVSDVNGDDLFRQL